MAVDDREAPLGYTRIDVGPWSQGLWMTGKRRLDTLATYKVATGGELWMTGKRRLDTLQNSMHH